MENRALLDKPSCSNWLSKCHVGHNSKNENAEITFDKHSEVADDEEEDSEWKKNVGRILNCEDGSFMPKSKFADHKEEKHPAKKRKFKEFSDGNFFMMAD